MTLLKKYLNRNPYSTEVAVVMESLEASTSTLNENQENELTDDSQVLPGFCQSLESVLRQGLKVGSLGLIGLLDRDYWSVIDGLSSSSRVTLRPPPSINHAITVVKGCKKTSTSQGRGRLFIRVALTKGILVQALEALLQNQEYVRYWYKDASPLVDYRRKDLVMGILKSLKKRKYNLDVNNCSFLDETWLLPRVEKFEFVPCALLGLTLVSVDGKSIITQVKSGSVAEEHEIEPGDCLDELFGQYIDEKWCLKVGQLKKKYQGKPITACVIKARYKDGRWFPPLYKRYQVLCAEGRCSMTATEFQQRKSESHETDSEKVTSQHTFTIDYLGFHNVGENGSCIYVQDGIDNVLKADNQKRTVKMQLLERDILVMFSDTGEVSI
ncbi:uncharacterized protein [Clytia hemisphaerica]|uniref:uncharacterized protein n=1 Tax=Clytia hemisphaerica TaxID=252671 RepID=UPI0034D416F8